MKREDVAYIQKVVNQQAADILSFIGSDGHRAAYQIAMSVANRIEREKFPTASEKEAEKSNGNP